MESLQSKFPELKGESPQIYKIFKHILNYAKTNLEVLIQGETGTGKELIARALHQASPREKRCFVSVNCAAIPPTLFESEFFGHCKGAFTHATECRKGRFLAADKGTIFLDEISETPPRIQVGLLRVLQEGELTPLGKDIPIKVNVRVIVATNKDLLKEVNEGRFREDLYYRLNVLKIYVPPLRERRVDIPILAKEFLKDFKSTNSDFLREMRKSEIEISQKAMEILKNYEWPGNIRELKNVIQRAAMLASINRNFKKDSILIMPEDIKIEDKIRISKHPSLEKVASDLLPLSYERGLKRVIEELKGKIIEMAVQGNRSQKQAAAKLKISEASISQKRNEG
jgi:two-component system response regulator HydG